MKYIQQLWWTKGKEPPLFHFDLLLLLLFLLISIQLQISVGLDSIFAGSTLSSHDTITSEGGVFEMGLFSPGNSNKYFLGIWYKDLPLPEKTVVWVANRRQPISDPNSTSLEFGEGGNLVLLSTPGLAIWSTNLTLHNPLPNSTMGVLGGDGNFILRERSNLSSILWQSFDHPTDTWLPGAKLGYDNHTGTETTLISWKDIDDPSPGFFSAKYFYGEIEVLSRNGFKDLWIHYEPETNYIVVHDFSTYMVLSVMPNYGLFRYVLDVTGQIKLLAWWEVLRRWTLILSIPMYSFSPCSCGEFTICDQENPPFCHCIKGFVTKIQDNYQQGCARRVDLHCNKLDKFFVLPRIRYPRGSKLIEAKNSDECQWACFADCSCVAYKYVNICSIWKNSFANIQQLSSDEEVGGDFYVRLAASEIEERRNKRVIWVIIVVVLISLAGFFIMLKIMWRKLHGGSLEAISDTLMHFKHQDIKRATKNFTWKLADGGFSTVYRGEFSNSTLVAVKQLKGQMYGDKQLRAEVNTIGLIQHKNLIRLRGFCLEHSERFLVYDYMPNVSLESHLFQEGIGILDWAKRYNIALGAAKGLAYLHESCRDCIIHCDIKPENILLDADFNPKVADFGLAKLLGRNFNKVLTTMRGTRGYLAPEWFSGEAITAKVDVFSYGQVLFEIISGRRNMYLSNDELSNYFPALVLNALNNGTEVMTLADPKLEGEVNREELTRACKVACWCIQDHEQDRPTMAQVIQILEGGLLVGVPPIPKFFQSLAEGFIKTSDFKESEIYSTWSSLPSGLTNQLACSSEQVQPILHMSQHN